jgi:hypothetical protein
METKTLTPEERAEINQRKTLLEKRKVDKASAMSVEERAERDETERRNGVALLEVMEKYGLTLPAREFATWRPTQPTDGRIEGIADGITCLATNGILGFFVSEWREPFIGHVQYFMWDTPVVSYVPFVNEHGEEKFFKSVKDHGAPAALHRREQRPRERTSKARKKTRGKKLVELALERLKL